MSPEPHIDKNKALLKRVPERNTDALKVLVMESSRVLVTDTDSFNNDNHKHLVELALQGNPLIMVTQRIEHLSPDLLSLAESKAGIIIAGFDGRLDDVIDL